MSAEANVTLVIGPPGDPFEIPPECPPDAGGIAWNAVADPEWEVRYTYAPPSQWVPGQMLLGAVTDAGSVPVSVIVRGTSLADLEARKAALSDALAAWPGEYKAEATLGAETVTVSGPWPTFPTVVRWGEMRVGILGRCVVEGLFALPVNPVGAP